MARLDELERRGTANGVPGLARVDRDRIAEIEPHVRALDGLHSPETGIVDYGRVAAAYADDVETAGGTITTGCGVTGVRVASGWLRLTHTSGETRARHALFCAGGWSDRLATMAGGGANPRIVPFRGAYMRLRPERRSLVRGMVYPVPDPELPFLGVHLTRRIDGEVLIGPSALLAGARDAYSLRRVRPADVASTLAWPGTYRMARRFWRTGIDEARHLLPGGTFVAAAAEFVPELRQSDVLPGSPASAPRRSTAPGGWSTTSCSRTPTVRCTCATRPRRGRPRRSRSPGTSQTRRSVPSTYPTPRDGHARLQARQQHRLTERRRPGGGRQRRVRVPDRGGVDAQAVAARRAVHATGQDDAGGAVAAIGATVCRDALPASDAVATERTTRSTSVVGNPSVRGPGGRWPRRSRGSRPCRGFGRRPWHDRRWA